ncbi:type II toxin-antitoxin system RelE/ParE family toxin [Clostridium sp. WILCCON 0269]|uniref:Type II toxin-antitoxin system RelE/ParE family toxin n=1 Tax=Candidatus Clostridium eludens TaxID=3381663 RepID=A0ABW8SF71_9CLOT
MSWTVEFTELANRDLNSFDKSQKIEITKAIQKVSQNPLPNSEGGYGKLLGHKTNNNLTGCCINFFKIDII